MNALQRKTIQLQEDSLNVLHLSGNDTPICHPLSRNESLWLRNLGLAMKEAPSLRLVSIGPNFGWSHSLDELDQFLLKIGQCQHLERLVLFEISVTDAHLTSILNGCKEHLHWLELKDLHARTHDFALCGFSQALGECSNLESIEFDQIHTLSDEGNFDFFVDCISSPPSLRKILLKNENIGDDGCAYICGVLQDQSNFVSLNTLELSKCGFGPSASTALATSISCDKEGLSSVTVKCGDLQDTASALTQSLERNNHLKDLDLQCTRLDWPSFAVVLASLQSNNTLESLVVDLNHPGCTKANLSYMSSMLQENYRLQIFTIRPNYQLQDVANFWCILNQWNREKMLLDAEVTEKERKKNAVACFLQGRDISLLHFWIRASSFKMSK